MALSTPTITMRRMLGPADPIPEGTFGVLKMKSEIVNLVAPRGIEERNAKIRGSNPFTLDLTVPVVPAVTLSVRPTLGITRWRELG